MSRKWRPRICCTWLEWMSHERQEWKCTQRRCLCCIRCFTTQEGLNGAKRSRPPWLCVIWRLFSMCNLWASAIHLLRAVCVWEKPRVWPLAQGWTPIPTPPSFFHSIPLLIGHFLFLSYILFGLTETRTHTHGSLKGIHLAVCETHILSSKHINILCACRHWSNSFFLWAAGESLT